MLINDPYRLLAQRDFPEASGFPRQASGKAASMFRRDSRMAERESSPLKRVLMLTLEMAVGTVAIFAWTGGSL
jgi:hypothetical protein